MASQLYMVSIGFIYSQMLVLNVWTVYSLWLSVKASTPVGYICIRKKKEWKWFIFAKLVTYTCNTIEINFTSR